MKKYLVLALAWLLAAVPARGEAPLSPFGYGQGCDNCVVTEVDRLVAMLGDPVLRELVCRLSSERYTPHTLGSALAEPEAGIMRRIDTLRGWGLARAIPNQWGRTIVEASPGSGANTLRRWASRYCPRGDECGRPLVDPRIDMDRHGAIGFDSGAVPSSTGGDGDAASPNAGENALNEGWGKPKFRLEGRGEWRDERFAKSEYVYFTINDSPVGRVLVAESKRGVRALYIGSTDEPLRAAIRRKFPKARQRSNIYSSEWTIQILRHLEKGKAEIDVPLDIGGTPFQRRVWEAVREIPYGESRSYGDIARQIGEPRAARAVARACALNPVSVVIPCHRVVAADGKLGGYQWGVDRKHALLTRERRLAK